jgi:Beta-ketoacyl synthase, N-terminal domain
MTEGAALAAPAGTPVKNRVDSLRFSVADWMACSPVRQGRQEWLAWAGGASHVAASSQPPLLPASLRRRVSAVGQMMFRAIYGLHGAPQARFVFCSRHGEYRRTKALLDAVAAGEAPSPAEFSLSVHNALAGLLSIAWQNDAGHTAVAAGSDSFGFGLLEAAACLMAKPSEPVLLAYFDEPLPDEYAAFREGEEASLALALLLTPGRGDGRDLRASCEAKRTGDAARPPPTAQALDFLRFLLSGESERASPGGAVRWRWRRDAA